MKQNHFLIDLPNALHISKLYVNHSIIVIIVNPVRNNQPTASLRLKKIDALKEDPYSEWIKKMVKAMIEKKWKKNHDNSGKNRSS